MNGFRNCAKQIAGKLTAKNISGAVIIGIVVVAGGSQILAATGNEKAIAVRNYLYMDRRPVEHACELAARQFEQNGKASSVAIEGSKRPDGKQLACTVGPANG